MNSAKPEQVEAASPDVEIHCEAMIIAGAPAVWIYKHHGADDEA